MHSHHPLSRELGQETSQMGQFLLGSCPLHISKFV